MCAAPNYNAIFANLHRSRRPRKVDVIPTDFVTQWGMLNEDSSSLLIDWQYELEALNIWKNHFHCTKFVYVLVTYPVCQVGCCWPEFYSLYNTFMRTCLYLVLFSAVMLLFCLYNASTQITVTRKCAAATLITQRVKKIVSVTNAITAQQQNECLIGQTPKYQKKYHSIKSRLPCRSQISESICWHSNPYEGHWEKTPDF